MSCSKALLSKKGVLGPVWVAAVSGVAALSRDQVVRTNIFACIDKILPDDDDRTTYRVLGLLLLGIARIYSKKVEYLCHECNELVGSYGSTHCTELSISTRGATDRVSKQVKKPVRPRRLAVRQDDAYKVNETTRAVRTTRAETRTTSQTSAEVREACTTDDLPVFTIPKRFELDSFDLGIPEDRDDDEEENHHQLPHRGSNAVIDVTTAKKPFCLRPVFFCIDTLLEDEPHHTSCLYESYKTVTCSYADLDSACIMPVRITIPTEIISAISEVNSLLCLSNIGGEPEKDNQNADSACFTPVKDILPPEMVDTMAKVNDPSDKSIRGKKPQRELNKDDNEDSACHIPLPGKEAQISENIVENATFPTHDANCPTIEESENGLLQVTNTNPSCNGVEEPESLETPTLRCKTKQINELSPSTPEPMTEGATGLPYSPKFMVTTPAKKEKSRVTKKRRRGLYNKDYIPTDRDKRQVRRRGTRALFDGNIVLPNKTLRKLIEDASDLVHRRRKAPHTYLDTWKEDKISSLPVTFMDPLILCPTSVYFKYTITSDTPKSSCSEPVKSRRRLSWEPSESNHICSDAQNVEGESIPDEPRKRKLDELTNSVQVTVGCYTENVQYQDDDCRFNEDTVKENDFSIRGHESHSTEPQERLYAPKSNDPLLNEALCAAIDNIDEGIHMDEQHPRDEGLLRSTRTRTVASYLHQLLVDQKCQQGNDSVCLSQALKGTKRKTSARFFYETLILKSGGLIKVNQEQPYEDIMVSATPQLEEALRSSDKK
ncbi:sister chromatid cohesion 1 protein 2 isoform X2 [Oryza brachyantha]|uniref:sister chromatid cohesion 1 protein 2 isoform X2 n=1 Tax=Oryza brachyantha TaxID=4533 RepID=UPI001ADC0CA8|nr:sister chromatid cohesion 1 protein 2 isoform X2 [Oryza brachyantha]